MVSIVKSGAIPDLTRVQLMPFWYTRAQWQLQFPKQMVYQSDITWQNIKKTTVPNENTKYCPGWAAPKKKGRPKNDTRKLGIADHVQQATAKRSRRNNKRKSVIVHETIGSQRGQCRDCTVRWDRGRGHEGRSDWECVAVLCYLGLGFNRFYVIVCACCLGGRTCLRT